MTTAVIAGFGCTLRLDAAGILRTRVFSSKFTMRPEPQVAGPLLLLHSSPAGLTPGPDLVCNSDGPAMSGGPRGWTARAHSLIHGPRHRVSTVQSRARPLRCHQSLTGPGGRPQCHGCRLSWSRCPAGSLARLATVTVTVRVETSHRIRPASPCPSESRQVSPTRRHGYERPDRTVAFSKAILTRNRPTRTPRRRS